MTVKWTPHFRPLAVALIAAQTAVSVFAAPLPAVDPGARMRGEDGAGEYWDVSVQLDGGAYFFARFWVTNEGPGTHTGVVMGYFLQPDGKRSDFKYGKVGERWTLASDGRYLQIASAILDLREPDGRVEVDTEKYGVKVFLRFAMRPPPPPLCARRGERDGFDVLRLGEEVHGLAWVEGMPAPLSAKGFLALTHGWSAVSEIDYLQRRIETSGRSGDIAFYAASVESPAGARSDCVAILRNGSPLFESFTAAAESGVAPFAEAEAAYPVPAELRFAADQVQLEVQPRRELLRVNPLDIVPQPFRALLAPRSSPRRVWTEATWRLRLGAAPGREAIDASGSGLTALSFTNPREQ